MQYKKDEIKADILKASENVFFEKGYDKASIRLIVSKAHTSIGNFYNYFDSKQSLYESLVGEIYEHMNHLILHHNDFDKFANLRAESKINLETLLSLDRSFLKTIIGQFFPPIDKRFSLLMTGSNTTPYHEARYEFQSLLEEHFLEHIMEFNQNYPYKEFGSIIAYQLVEGLIEIGRKDLSKERTTALAIELIIFIAIGTIGIMQGGHTHE